MPTKKLPPSILAKIKAQQNDIRNEMRKKEIENEQLRIREERLKKEEDERIQREMELEQERINKMKIKKKEKQKNRKARADDKYYDDRRKRLETSLGPTNNIIMDNASEAVSGNEMIVENSMVNDIDKQKYIVCVLGHVNSGKTRLLDILSNKDTREAGDITQEIRAVICRDRFICIDTPGHEFFETIRMKGGSGCHIALIIIDIMKGLEQTTYESIDILKRSKTPFVIVLNKLDRIYDWIPDIDFDDQNIQVKSHFNDLINKIKIQFATSGLNAELWNKNPDPKHYLNMVPISCKTLEGIETLISVLQNSCQKYHKSLKTNGLLLHKKKITGIGTMSDYILGNRVLDVNDMVPGTTDIVKALYIISDTSSTNMAGLKSIYHVEGPNIIRILVEEHTSMIDFSTSETRELDKYGIFIQASNTCILDSIIQFVSKYNIHICGSKIGNINLKDLKWLCALNRDHLKYNCILSFDSHIGSDIELFAKNNGIKIFKYNIIYDIQKDFIPYIESLNVKEEVIQYPSCKMTIISKYIFRKCDPIIVGVQIIEGKLVLSAPIHVCTEDGKYVNLGTITEIRKDDEPIQTAIEGQKYSIMISGNDMVIGKHFQSSDILEVITTPI
jgi:translation initiation factor 5B